MEMLATDILPFAVVEGAGFKKVTAEVGPRHLLKKEIIPYKEDGRDLCKIKKLLSDEIAGNSISFTTNCWSGSN